MIEDKKDNTREEERESLFGHIINIIFKERSFEGRLEGCLPAD